MARLPEQVQGQLELLVTPATGRARETGSRRRYTHRHTQEELAAFERTLARLVEIRPAFLADDERMCAGGCGKIVRGRAWSCGRRWCDAVRKAWGESFKAVIHSALEAYCGLYGAEAKVLQGVITCTAEPWWWDRSKCSHVRGLECSGLLGCRVLPEIETQEREQWAQRKRDALNAARTRALRMLKRAGYEIAQGDRWPDILVWVVEDQKRGLPHLHFVLGHTTAMEKAFAKAFFRSLKVSCPAQGLGHSSTYERAVFEQGKYEAGRLRAYVTKLARYLAKDEGGAEFLRAHAGERVFYVAPWLSRLSGMTMTIARLCRRVHMWRLGKIERPSIPQGLLPCVERLVGSLDPSGP